MPHLIFSLVLDQCLLFQMAFLTLWFSDAFKANYTISGPLFSDHLKIPVIKFNLLCK